MACQTLLGRISAAGFRYGKLYRDDSHHIVTTKGKAYGTTMPNETRDFAFLFTVHTEHLHSLLLWPYGSFGLLVVVLLMHVNASPVGTSVGAVGAFVRFPAGVDVHVLLKV